MQLSEIGRVAESDWLRTKTIRADMNLELGEFVIMPNHMHGIIIINENRFNVGNDDDRCDDGCRDAMHRVSTTTTTTTTTTTETEMETGPPASKPANKFGSQSKNLASIMRGYKSAVTTYARKNGIRFKWQPGYYDRVIRSKNEYIRIAQYIVDNPSNWEGDKFHPKR